MAATEKAAQGITFPGALFIAFLVLKLTHVIAWSWWWVTAPLWGVPVVALAFVAGALIIAGIVAVVSLVRS